MSLILEELFKGLHTLDAKEWKDIPGYEQFADHLHDQFFFEIYEDNGGALCLCILDHDLSLRRVFDDWEQLGDGCLRDALKRLTEDETDYELWGNDILFQDRFTEEDLQEMYKDGRFGDLIADNHGVYLDDLGSAGHSALGIPREYWK